MQRTLVRSLLALLFVVACSSSSAEPPTDPQPPRDLPPGVTAAMVTTGSQLYSATSCIRCHGPQGKNGPYCPDLTDNVWLHGGRDYDNLVRIITAGMPADSFRSPGSRAEYAMFPRGGLNLTDEQIRAIAAYVWTLSP